METVLLVVSCLVVTVLKVVIFYKVAGNYGGGE
jgi:hypothetical protein